MHLQAGEGIAASSLSGVPTHPLIHAAPDSPLTVLTPGVVPAAQASASVGVALVCVPMADTGPAAREPPLAPLAAVTAKPKCTSSAGALPTGGVTQAAERPLGAALAGWGQGGD